MKAFHEKNLKRVLLALVFAMCASALTACGGGAASETAFTAALGPADAALPYQAVFAVDKDADDRLIAASQSFCRRMAEFSGGGAAFSLVLSNDALQDLKAGKADVILLKNPNTDAFAPITEAFRYRSYEHFAMTVNADATLRILSDLLDVDVFAGFYAGSNVFLSRGTLDSKFRPSARKKPEDVPDTQAISVTALSDSTAHAFSLLKAEATVAKELSERIRACSTSSSVVEFAYSELNSPSLLAVLRENAAASLIPAPVSSDEDDSDALIQDEPEPFVATQAFSEIKPVWLVFADSGYEKLSQTNRAAAAEAAAYMVSDIDGVYLEYEREMMELLAAEEVMISRDFAATRVQVLRLADEQGTTRSDTQRKLRDAIARIQ